jgi:hypothetical protein
MNEAPDFVLGAGTGHQETMKLENLKWIPALRGSALDAVNLTGAILDEE